MLFHFAKVIVRYLSRKAFFTGLNVAGLTVGLSSCIIIFLFVSHELSYDKFHVDGVNTYRVIRESRINGMPYDIGVTAAPFGPALLEEYSASVKDMTRALAFNGLVAFKDRSFIEERLLLADKNFFTFFSFPLSHGDARRVLYENNSLVISRALAEKYFGAEDPIGQIISLDDQYDMKITGVMDAFPGNSHLQFDAVGSINIAEDEEWFSDWWGNAFYTYIKTANPAQAQYLNESFPSFMEKYFGKDFARVGNKIGLKLEPLHDIYFNYNTRYENNVKHGDRRYLYVFSSVGILLLLLAGINYINLATAQASTRAKEVAVRKTLGSSRSSVAFQFFSESFFLCSLSGVLALGLAQTVIPLFNNEFGLSLPGVFDSRSLWTFMIIVCCFMTVAAGSYPSLVLSSFKPVQVLKGQLKGDFQYLFARKALVTFQFAISGFMIISTLFIGKQLDFMGEKDLGFTKDQVLVVNSSNGLINRERLAFKSQLARQEGFVSASISSGHPGGFYDATTVILQGEEQSVRMRTLWADDSYLTTMGLKMRAGRFFSPMHPADSIHSVVLNSTAVEQIGWTPEEAIGKKVLLAQFDTVYREVVGVVEDYHFTSLKQVIEPLIISNDDTRGHLLVRISGSDLSRAVQSLETVWASYNTGFPLQFQFLDDVIGRLYHAEATQAKLFRLFSAISVLIACMGILGLGSYIAAQRTKEIGVRKVLGASTVQVSALLMKDLLILVIVANVLAVPIGYWVMEEWLQGFAYRISLDPFVFLVAAGAILLIASVIVGVNAARVALRNPVSSLRSE